MLDTCLMLRARERLITDTNYWYSKKKASLSKDGPWEVSPCGGKKPFPHVSSGTGKAIARGVTSKELRSDYNPTNRRDIFLGARGRTFNNLGPILKFSFIFVLRRLWCIRMQKRPGFKTRRHVEDKKRVNPEKVAASSSPGFKPLKLWQRRPT